MGKRILVAMSGGVDSTAAALLLRQQGHDLIGATLLLSDRGKGGLRDIEEAQAAARRLGMEHHVLDERAAFRTQVMQRFVDGYRSGETPNPCIDCNRLIKFGRLLDHARRLGADAIATGHYARVEVDPVTGRSLLLRGTDAKKDQSYVLYDLRQQQLSRMILPLGNRSKEDIRRLTAESGLVRADRPESQDICFIPDGNYAAFIEAFTDSVSEPGDFIDRDGRVLGRHNGLIRYTIGQRKGIGIQAAEPLYVIRKDPETNRIVLGPEEALFSDVLHARAFNLISVEHLEAPVHVTVRTRYHQTEQPGLLYPPDKGGRAQIRLEHPVRAPAPGQGVVCYLGDAVVGGGTLSRPPEEPID